jgi:colicin import membrane protein
MARALKTYITSIGFFDLAVAAPSMKAALEAWGVQRNLFHQGLATETDDPAIVKATMDQPGVVLRRAVGTKAAFKETAELPNELPASAAEMAPPPKTSAKQRKPPPRTHKTEKAEKAAIIQFAKAKAQRERQRAREEADRAKRQATEERKEQLRRREEARIQAQIEKARERHENVLAEIQQKREALDRASDAEKRRWGLERERLEREIEEP